MGKTLDFSGTGGKILDDGLYVLTIKSIKEKKSSTNKDMWLVCFEEPETGAVAFENYILESSSAWKIKELLKAVGLDVPEGNMELPEVSELVGLQVTGKTEQTEYNGEPRNSVKKVFAV